MGGHVFIIYGDLTKVACDAILIPTDLGFSLNPHWRDLLNADHASELAEFTQSPAESWRSRRVIRLKRVRNKPRVWLGNVGQIGNHSDFAKFEPVVREFVSQAVKTTKIDDARRIYAWPKPRLAVNLIGSGHGGGSRRKGHLVYGLVKTLRELVCDNDVDIILVTFGVKPYAAAQRARRELIADDEALRAEWQFEEQPRSVDLAERARYLAKQAINSQLVPFIGAGVSVGAGLPLWRGLLREVAKTARIEQEAVDRLTEKDPRDQATILERRLESRKKTTLRNVVAGRLEVPCYALAHGLLASLPSKEAVTTNFDRLFETAWRSGNRSLAILPDSAVDAGGRWLLKLHGTVAEPQKIVLTRSDFLDMPRQYGALMGLVQGLLMMRHMMFVGYSLQDEDFHELIHEVRAAEGHKNGPKFPETVLTLREDKLETELWLNDLDIVPMIAAESKIADTIASRQLEIFLDLVCYLSTTSAAFFLDTTYNELSREETLRETLTSLVDDTKDAEFGTVGYTVRQFLRDELGAD